MRPVAARSHLGWWAGAVLALMWASLLLAASARGPLTGPPADLASGTDGVRLHVTSAMKAGQRIDAEATLVIGGFLRSDADVRFFIDGIERGVGRTDVQGTAHLRLPGIVASGSHQLTATYGGSIDDAALSASSSFVIAPHLVTVQTVPAMPGVVLAIDGGAGTASDATGKAVLGVERVGIHVLAVRIPASGPTARYSFSRWSDDYWTSSRPLRVAEDIALAVGLRVAYLTPIRFTDLDGHPLDERAVSDVAISGPNAELQVLQYPFEPIWLQTPMPAKLTGENGLHITPAPYSISLARYNGLNVASAGKVRYSPSSGGTWSIPLLLFTLRLDARDAMFGTSLREPIRLTGPSGRTQVVQLDRDGKATLVLARGNYAAQEQASGMAPVATIALSRSQTVVVPVITPLDLSVLVAVCLVVMGAVFAIGRGRGLVFSLVRAPAMPRVGRPFLLRTAPEATLSPGAEDDVGPPPSFASRMLATFPQSGSLANSDGTGRAEVGAIMRGLMDAGKAGSFLLLAQPSSMLDWQRLLKEQFSISIPRLERDRIFDPGGNRLAWSGNPWKAFPLLLASSSLARRRDRREDLLSAAPWDVLVVDGADEAHSSGGSRTRAPNQLLALLQAMKSSQSWKAVYLITGSIGGPQADAADLTDLIESQHAGADATGEPEG